jgi:hypothetical protein
MTVPGVNVIVAATFMAAVGDIRRFADRRKLTVYLGPDPKVRQPGPIAAFSQRIRARRGHSIAIVASVRKLACLFWCLLSRGELAEQAQLAYRRNVADRQATWLTTAGAPRTSPTSRMRTASLIAAATLLELPPIGNSHAPRSRPTSRLSARRNESDPAPRPLLVPNERLAGTARSPHL